MTCLCEIPNAAYTLERFLIMTTNILTDEPFESPNLLIFTSFPARQKFRIFKQFSYSVADFRLSQFLTCSFFRLVFFSTSICVLSSTRGFQQMKYFTEHLGLNFFNDPI